MVFRQTDVCRLPSTPTAHFPLQHRPKPAASLALQQHSSASLRWSGWLSPAQSICTAGHRAQQEQNRQLLSHRGFWQAGEPNTPAAPSPLVVCAAWAVVLWLPSVHTPCFQLLILCSKKLKIYKCHLPSCLRAGSAVTMGCA